MIHYGESKPAKNTNHLLKIITLQPQAEIFPATEVSNMYPTLENFPNN